MDKTQKPFAITPAYDLLLRGSPSMPVGLYHLHLATAEQLCRLHYKMGTFKTVSKRLKALVDNGYVQADCIPTKNFRSPYYYTLGTKGLRYLSSVGIDVPASDRASKEIIESYLHLRHALELNDVLIAALRLKLVSQQAYLHRYMHERTLKRTPYPAEVDGRRVGLVPDGLLDIRIRRQGSADALLPLVLEHDRGTEQQEHFRRRIRAYKSFIQSGAYKQLLGIEHIIVAFTTFTDMRRVAQMRAWTWAEVRDDAALSNQFLFAQLPRPLEPQNLLHERRWYTLQQEQPIALLEG